eukprot:TRINITY_DN2983_c0_g2_i1.p1 TRINITY_DN2983_c0_g2~~TRINITY_DN2983_c0_g2_i1.p1  ORF type:complete len:310 (+),score=55.89 TRINITY_DN2983_c0_g2_i1:62-991(+)
MDDGLFVSGLICVILGGLGSIANLVLCSAIWVPYLRGERSARLSLSTRLVGVHAFFDFIFATWSGSLVGYGLVASHLPDPVCQALGFGNHFAAGVSLLFMMVMAWERYQTITKLTNHLSPWHFPLLTLATFVFSIIYASLHLFGVGRIGSHGVYWACFLVAAPDAFTGLTILYVAGSCLVTVVLYILVFRYVKQVVGAAAASSSNNQSLELETAVARSFVVSVCFYLFCWTPLLFVWLLELGGVTLPSFLVPWALINGIGHTIADPILYVTLNINVRKLVLDPLPCSKGNRHVVEPVTVQSRTFSPRSP